MKINRRSAAAAVLSTAAISAQSSAPVLAQPSEGAVTHGPFLGHVRLNEVHIWARTARAGSFVMLPAAET